MSKNHNTRQICEVKPGHLVVANNSTLTNDNNRIPFSECKSESRSKEESDTNGQFAANFAEVLVENKSLGKA
jgi:hypothetical protein